MRCEHEVPPRLKGFKIRTDCGRRLKSVSRRALIGGLTWHVYRCRRGHETRFYVKGVQ